MYFSRVVNMSQKSEIKEFFASSVSGSESVLCDELRELGFQSVRLNLGGGIPFRGEWEDGWRACLQSRIAQRIQVLLNRFPAATPEALYDGVQAVDWHPYITSKQTLAVRSVCLSSQIHHSGFAALKVKDAIVDQVRAATGMRPSVSTDDPDVRVFLYLVNDKASLYLDLSGVPLHRRGYRQQAGDAPLRETVAAAMLRMSEWDRKTPLLDPMCGSGTIAIEAAMLASNIPPGLARGRFGFERWANFNEEKMASLKALCGELRSGITDQGVRIQGLDNDAGVLAMARANARSAGVRISFKERSVFNLHDDGTPRLLISNPPYGIRLEKEPEFVRKSAARFRKLHGWRVCLLAESDEYERAMPMPPVKKVPLRNGPLDCDLLIYDIP